MGSELTLYETDRQFIQECIIPSLQAMMIADWDNFEDPRFAAEALYTGILEYLNPPE